jgi:hypothetical protein
MNILQKLNEFKELITIIVFFLGGFVWLDSQFPTREDLKRESEDLKREISITNCLLDKYMVLTQLQIKQQQLDKLTSELKMRIATATPSENDGNMFLSPAMKLELEQLKEDLKFRKNDLDSNLKEMEKLRDELARNDCRKVTL